MKKVVFSCPIDGTVDVIKVTDKNNIVREKDCPKCKKRMNFIRQNKKKYKIIYKKANA
jgi:transcriptional regulator NrdR family protein